MHCFAQRIIALLLVACSACTQQAYAQSVAAPIAPRSAPSPSGTPTSNTGTYLDLTSAQLYSAGNVANFGSANIQQNGQSVNVGHTDMLNSGQITALQQVLTTGRQSIVLGANGSAIGGSVHVSANHDTVSIPTGVTAIFNATQGILNVAGNLTNAGNFYLVSNGASAITASIVAQNIFNLNGGLITTVLPAAGIAGYSNLSNNLNLNITAVNQINNAGIISSAGNLNVSAGGGLINAPTNGISPPTMPTMQAAGTATFQATSLVNRGLLTSLNAGLNINTSNLTNAGTIQALAGSVLVKGQTMDLNIDNTLGLIAARDNLTFLTQPGVEGRYATLTSGGGVFSAKDVSFTTKSGQLAVAADRIDGNVHIRSGTAALGVMGGDLNMTTLELTGDPIFYNAGGNLNLALANGTTSSSGGDFVALATGNITATGITTAGLLDASKITGPGGTITLAAGSTFTVTGGASPITCTTCGGLYTITGTSATGGNVTIPLLSLKTNANTVNVTAKAGSAAAGTISLANIDTAGGGANFTAPSTVAVQNITTTASGTTGNAGALNVNAGGNFTAGTITARGGTTTGNGGVLNVTASNITATTINSSAFVNGNAGTVNFVAVGNNPGTANITTGAVTANGGSTTGNAGGITLSAGGNNNSNNSILNMGALTTNAGGTGNGGDVYLYAGNAITGSTITANGGSTSGVCGSLTINNPYAAGTISLGNITMTGALPLQGFKGVTATSIGNITTGQITVNGSVNLYSVYGNTVVTGINTSSTSSFGGAVLLQTGTGNITVGTGGINTSGAGTGAGGNVEIFAPGTAVTVRGNINTTGPSAGSLSVVANTLLIGDATATTYAIDTSSSSGTAAAGDINIATAGNMTFGGNSTQAINITANGGTTSGTGGDIFLTAGNSGSGNVVFSKPSTSVITTRNYDSNTHNTLTIMAPGLVTLGATTSTGLGNGLGGYIAITAGTSGTSGTGGSPAAPAQGGTLTVGNITTSSTGLAGGNVSVINMATNGNLAGGNILASATADGGNAGSIAVLSNGGITLGSIAATSVGGNGNRGYSGDIVISSGKTSGVAISVGAIDLRTTGSGAKKGGNIFLLYRAGATESHGSINQNGSSYLYNTALSLASIQSTLSGNTTLNFSQTGVSGGYNPGGYDSIAAGNITITGIDKGGSAEDRLLVPIAGRGGDITIGSLTAGVSNTTPILVSLAGAGNITFTNSSGLAINSISAAVGSGSGTLLVNSSAGSVNFTSGTTGINISGPEAGGISIAAARDIVIPNGASIDVSATTNATAGGIVNLLSAGSIKLGSSGNTTSNEINASGLSGGIIHVVGSEGVRNYETSLRATGTTGAGGTVSLKALNGPVFIFNNAAAGANADIDVSSTSSLGGRVILDGPQAFYSGSESGAANTSIINANGFREGGTVQISSSAWAINTNGYGLISARALGAQGVGGSVTFNTSGQVNANSIDVSGPNGGQIMASGFIFQMNDGHSINADGTAGSGGLIRLLFPYQVNFGYSGNSLINRVTANGTVAGGTIDVATQIGVALNNTSLEAKATTGHGGVINLQSFSGDIGLYQATGNTKLDVSSTSGLGGMIHLVSALGITSGGTGNGFISANGAAGGGSILLSSTSAGSIALSNLSSVSANATSGVGGSIMLAAFGSGSIAATTTPLSANGSASGGDISAISQSTIALGSVSANSTSTGLGGSIFVSGVSNIATGALSATGNGRAGGNLFITTAQPDPNVTGTTLSQSGAAALPFASGTVSVGSFNVSGSSAGTAQMYTSGGAAITGAGAATTSTTQQVLPKTLALTSNYTLALSRTPGGSFNTFSNTATLTLSGFPVGGSMPLAVTPSNVALGTVSAAGQSFTVVAGGAVSYTSINTATSGINNGGSVSLYSLSSASNTIAGSGTIQTRGNGAGFTAGTIVLDAPFGSYATNSSLLAVANGSASAANILLNFGTNVSVTGGSLEGNTLNVVSSDGSVNLNLSALTGNLSGSSGGDFVTLVSSGNLNAGSIVTTNGSIELHQNQVLGVVGTAVNILPDSVLLANSGNILIENDVTVLIANLGNINIGNRATITALSPTDSSLGNVTVAVGAPPAGSNTTPPANVIVSTSGGGIAYFGPFGGVTATGTNYVNAVGSTAKFNSASAGRIRLNGDVVITADPPMSNFGGASPMVFSAGLFFDGLDQSPNSAPTINPTPVIPPARGASTLLFPALSAASTSGVPVVTALASAGGLFQPSLSTVFGGQLSGLVPTDKTPVFDANGYPGLNSFGAWRNDNDPALEVKRKRCDNANEDATGSTEVLHDSTFEPIAFSQPATGAISDRIKMQKIGTAMYWVSKGTKLQTNNSGSSNKEALVLSGGDALVWASATTTVKAGPATVSVKGGSGACISVVDGVVCVRNIYEEHANGVEVAAHQRTVKLNVGGEFVVETAPGALDHHVQTASSLARRKVTMTTTADSQSMVSEVSFTSLVDSNRLLHDVFYSEQSGQLGIAKRITKLMAALTVATAGHGPYQLDKK